MSIVHFNFLLLFFYSAGNFMYFMGFSKWLLLASRLVAGESAQSDTYYHLAGGKPGEYSWQIGIAQQDSLFNGAPQLKRLNYKFLPNGSHKFQLIDNVMKVKPGVVQYITLTLYFRKMKRRYDTTEMYILSKTWGFQPQCVSIVIYSWRMYFPQALAQAPAHLSLASWPEALPQRTAPLCLLLSWHVDKLAFWLVSAPLLSDDKH